MIAALSNQLSIYSPSFNTVTMSAIIPENGDLQPEVVKVLFCLYPGFDLADVTGPLATLSAARHDKANASQ